MEIDWGCQGITNGSLEENNERLCQPGSIKAGLDISSPYKHIPLQLASMALAAPSPIIEVFWCDGCQSIEMGRVIGVLLLRA